MSDKALQYVSKYVAEPRILSILPNDDPLMVELPEWWQGVLQADGGDRTHHVIQAWAPYRRQLPLTFKFLSTHLQSVNLLIDKMSVRLLYELEQGGQTMYYAGGNPTQKSMSSLVRDAWDKLPADFRKFYDSLHNGWYYLASNSLGPSPTEDFFILDELEWGILEEISDPGCDLKDLLAVYTNGMSAYVAISIGQKGAYGNVLWWKDKSPYLNIDAWSVIDAWTEIGLNK